jgi:hypothetical protein
MISLIAIPLAYNGYNLNINNAVTQNVQEASTNWLNGTEYKVASVNAENANNTVILVVIGNGNLPPMNELEQLLDRKLYGKTLQVEVVPSSTYYLNN